jgi:hypothetical protein
VDKRNGRFDDTLAALREHYGAGVFPLNLPINPGAGFNQALDVRRNEVVNYDTSDGRASRRNRGIFPTPSLPN